MLNNDKSPQLQGLVLNDVTPLSIGKSDYLGVMKVFIPRNSKIPIKVTQRNWTTIKDNQTSVCIQVYEGERAMCEDNVHLGKFVLEGLPPKKKGEVKIQHTFYVDKDGILTVNSICQDNGNECGTTIKHRQGYLTEEAVDKLLDESRKFKEEDKENLKRVNDRRYQQLKAEKLKIETQYSTEMQMLAQRQANYTEEILKRDKEYENMKNNMSNLMEKAKQENRVERQKLQKKLEQNEKRTSKINLDYEKKLKSHQEEHVKVLDQLEKRMKCEREEEQRKMKLHQDQMEKKLKQEQSQKTDELRRRMSQMSQASNNEISHLKHQMTEQNQDFQKKMAKQAQESRKQKEELKRQADSQKKELLKIIELKDYEKEHPKPEVLKQHQLENPNSFYIQFIGCRGVGKSTLINNLLGVEMADTGTEETTTKTGFYKITAAVQNTPSRYTDVYLVDQPGIGGLETKEAGYLAKYGPGHFNFTFILCKGGFHELDLNILKHLIHNGRPVAIIRTQCDETIRSIRRDSAKKVNFFCHSKANLIQGKRLSFEEAFDELQNRFRKYIDKDVLPKTKLENIGKFLFYVFLLKLG